MTSTGSVWREGHRLGPLSGMCVVEVSSFVAAPLAGMTLAQMGADVIRIDPTGGAGDRHRWPIAASGSSIYWAGLNRGKRSVTVDFSSESGRAVISDLLRACPRRSAVLLTNSVGRPWLTYEALHPVAPDLIHVQIEGHADGSPAVDYTINAEVGFPIITGPMVLSEPVNHVLPAWDIACGLYAAFAASAAAYRRLELGEGECINIALADVALASAGNLGFLGEAQINGTERQRIGNHLYGGFARDFECADGGRIMVVALTDRQWRELVQVTSTEAAVEAVAKALRADFSREADRFEHREVLAALLSPWFSTRVTDDALGQLAGTKVLWGRYRSLRETAAALASSSPNAMFDIVEDPGIGPYLAPGSPVRLASGRIPPQPAPSLGGSTRDVLAALRHTGDQGTDH
jgi:2-methylfumaryl-CoA isomerase